MYSVYEDYYHRFTLRYWRCILLRLQRLACWGCWWWDNVYCLIYEILHNIVRNVSSGAQFWPICIPRVLLFSSTALNFNVCIKMLVCVCWIIHSGTNSWCSFGYNWSYFNRPIGAFRRCALSMNGCGFKTCSTVFFCCCYCFFLVNVSKWISVMAGCILFRHFTGMDRGS